MISISIVASAIKYQFLAEYQERYKQLRQLQHKFQSNNMTLVVGAELEFYLSSPKIISVIAEKIGYEIKPEKGRDQYEIEFKPTTNLALLACEIELVRQMIKSICFEHGYTADFRAKPFTDDYGSSMHIHINFLEENDVARYAQILCHSLDRYIDFCLPSVEDYLRLDKRFMAPTHICWGNNNRTVMIRIPSALPMRIEHRLPGANVEPALLLYNMMESLYNGLFNKHLVSGIHKELPKIYGNAFDEQYALIPIIMNMR